MADNDRRDMGALPDGWVWTTLGHVCYPPQYGWTTSASKEGSLRLLRTTDITSGRIDWASVPFCSEEPPAPGKYLLHDGDIVVSRAGSVGYSHLVKNSVRAVFASYLIRFRPLIDQQYLAYFLWTPSYWESISEKKLGIAIPNVNASKLKQIVVPLAPLPEQRRIVNEIETQFTRLDAGVAALKRVQAKLKRYRASVLKAACEGRLVPTEAELARAEGRAYEPAGVLLDRILAERRKRWEAEQWAKEIVRAKKKAAQAKRKAAGLPHYIRDLEPEDWQGIADEEYRRYLPKNEKWKEKYEEPAPPDMEELGELPEGWVWASAGEVGEVSGGLTKNRNRANYSMRLPYLRVANVYASELRLDDVKYLGVQESELERVLLKKGDLLVVEGNGSEEQIGRVAIWNDSIKQCVHQNHLIKVRFDPVELGRFALHWLLSREGRKFILSVASSTSGLYTLSLSKVGALPLPLPPVAEQSRITFEVDRLLSVAEDIEKQIEAALRRAERLRQAILKHAFEGKLVPQDPDDEPASALLERIRGTVDAPGGQRRLPGV